jgi:diaminohydroxyphosphoribosylaminopyrimidine deaminase/5-amino-6-(5-phosphoribosylamino)uracil reductase
MTVTDPDRFWLTAAIDLSRQSPPSSSHYAVGAIVVDQDGEVLATGYTGEINTHYHAEEAALAKLGGFDLSRATLYTSLEPCTVRKSRPDPCTGLTLTAGLRRVVLALREPLLFADCDGVEVLRRAGVEVIEIADLGPLVREVNSHLLDLTPLVTP